MDCLNAADMPAVLERTNLKATPENFLLPIYESISNAIYSTQEKYGEDVSSEGHILLDVTTGSFSAKIVDNGSGFNDRNYESFKTPFTSFRLKKGGKGFGRFIAFKVFDKIVYKSLYNGTGEVLERAFDFDIYSENEFLPATKNLPLKHDEGCVVYYEGPKVDFIDISKSMSPEDMVERIIRYFLPFFISGHMPVFKIVIDGTEFDTREHFKEFFTPQIELEADIDIGGETHSFKIDIAKVDKSKLFDKHALLLFADGRIIGSGRNIEGKIGKAFFLNADNKKQIYVASVSGDFLDRRANTARTQIEADASEIDEIVKVVSSQILEQEKEFVKTHRNKQGVDVQKAIMRNPLLRTGLKGASISEYVSSNPMNWKT